ncbi:MAG: sodium:proton antiporter [Neisseriaceae bacterium]|nr:sodium:proton antiporter [Neisseriaceae bacterium]
MRLFFVALLSLSSVANASALDGSYLNLSWGIPFAMILLFIALGGVLIPKLWHHHYGKITLAWTLLFLVPFSIFFGGETTLHVVAHALIEEYIPFILLLLALYTVSGGILIWGTLNGTPATNTKLLAIGTLLSSLMGTTGAAMLMIRPLLRANGYRKHRVHTVVFFIFLVANIGGGLTPLGDPPLFLGFLKGVTFGWTVKHMLVPVLLSSVILLIAFYFIDNHFYRQDGEILPHEKEPPAKIKIFGKGNFLLLIGIVGTVLLSGIWRSGASFTILGTTVTLEAVTRDCLLIVITLISLWLTPNPVRAGNEFNFEPIIEVAKLFAGIFITIAPVLAMLQAGEQGPFKFLLTMAHNNNNEPINAIYFWLTGILSSFLDNAPTYLVFFNMASGNADYLMSTGASTLMAISMGAVFMGAMTYIGNAPNFMVRSIAKAQRVEMPSFFGYVLWSVAILGPLFLLHTLIFFW